MCNQHPHPVSTNLDQLWLKKSDPHMNPKINLDHFGLNLDRKKN